MLTRIIAFTVLMVAPGLVEPSIWAQAQSAQTQRSQAPAKIGLAPLHLENHLGQEVPLQLHLLDQYGKQVPALSSIQADVKVEQPSGQTATYAVTFAPGESAKQIPLSIGESGVAKVTVQQREQQLIGGWDYVLVRPPTTKSQLSSTPAKRAVKKAKGPQSQRKDIAPLRGRPVRLIFAAFAPQGPAPTQKKSTGAPLLQLSVSGEDANGGTRADGVTCAHVRVFYLGEGEVQRDVQIWLSPSDGELDDNRIVIKKGTAVGSGCWTAKYPKPSATIYVAATNPPNYAFASDGNQADPKKCVHKFTDNISGIEFVNAPKSLTIVDSFNLTARFTDSHGQPVRLTDKRELHFTADSAVLGVNPKTTTVDAGGFDSSTVLIPTYFGSSTVQAFTPDYLPVTHPITITWVSVLAASLLGGLLGGLLAWVNSSGNLWMRVFTGLVVGLVASWAYVIVGLPKLEKGFLHNQLSVFFVALLVGLTLRRP